VDLRDTLPPGAPGQPPEPGVRQRPGQVPDPDLAPPVALPAQRGHGVRSHVDGSVHTAGQVHAEERECRVRHRVDQAADQLPAAGDELRVQPGAADDLLGADVPVCGVDDRAGAHPGDRRAGVDLRAGPRRQPPGCGGWWGRVDLRLWGGQGGQAGEGQRLVEDRDMVCRGV
jgi:hypothetical protein